MIKKNKREEEEATAENIDQFLKQNKSREEKQIEIEYIQKVNSVYYNFEKYYERSDRK